MNLKLLNDLELHVETEKVAMKEKQATLELLEYLSEIDVRRIYAARGYSSLFEYVNKYLKYSESQSFERVNAMRLMRRIPEVKKCIESNAINMTVTSKLASHVKRENLTPAQTIDLLEKVVHKSTREVERVLIQEQSKPMPSKPDLIKPISKSSSRISFDADEEFMELLNQVKNSQSNPTLKLEEIFKKVMKEYVEKRKVKEPQSKKRLTALRAPQITKSESKYIPVRIKYEVRKRSNDQCEFIDSDTQKRCDSKSSLQFDHAIPRALNGKTSMGNMRHLCRAHNLYEAVRVLGIERMGTYMKQNH